MLVPVLIGLAVVIVLFVALVASRPADFRVARSAVIAAPAETVFAQVNTLRRWEAWNPWGKMDPDAKLTYSGPPSGIGASYAWAGNSKIGAGRSTIVDSAAGESVRLRLDFLKPMKATNFAEFTFKAEAGRTTVTWQMTGHNNFVGKAFALFVNFDQMCGGQFEKGLASLKSVTEK